LKALRWILFLCTWNHPSIFFLGIDFTYERKHARGTSEVGSLVWIKQSDICKCWQMSLPQL
jgi:hypothetical protein